jgi:hypothetical protein
VAWDNGAVDQEFRQLLLLMERRAAERDRWSDRNHRAYMARFDALQEDMREVREESRATHQALLRILDRLDGGGAAPA